MISPLVISIPTARTYSPVVGGLITVRDYAGRMVCGRLMRYDASSGNVWVKVVGFDTAPYNVGDVFARDISDVVDWD